MTTLFDTARYLREHAKSDFAHLPEGSVSKVLNDAPKDVRLAMLTAFKAREHFHDTAGRIDQNGNLKPFAPRQELPPVPKELDKTIDRLRTEEINQGLDQRMGTSADNERIINEAPTTLRDIIDVSFDAHGE